MQIGITERGDAGLDLSWVEKLYMLDGAVLITKNINDRFIQEVCHAHENGHKLVVHCTCTGLGETGIEPNVPHPKTQIIQLRKLINSGFPKSQCVLRIDPIIPMESCLERVKKIIDRAYSIGLLPDMRVRISVYDEYRHVKARMQQMGYQTIYQGNQFYASPDMFDNVAKTLIRYTDLIDLTYECCAEPMLTEKYPYAFKACGCISQKDLDLWGIPYETAGINPQNRNGCLCLACKTELLTNRCKCPHNCIYCYWKD